MNKTPTSRFLQKNLAPDFLSNLFNQRQFRPLLFFSQLIADLAGSKTALRAEIQPVKRDVLCSFMDSGNHGLFILQLRLLCGNQSENHFLSASDFCKRRKATGSFIIKLQIIGTYIFFAEQNVGHGVIGATAGIS